MRLALILAVLVALCACKRSAPESGDAMMIDAASLVELTVDVRADGTLALDGRTVKDETELTSEARAIADKVPVSHAVVYVEEGVVQDRVVATMNALKRGGVTHMSFGVRGSNGDASH